MHPTTYQVRCVTQKRFVLFFCSPKHGTHDPLPISPSNLDTLKLTDIRPKRTWSDVHEDFYREPPANPGKILLLYSPDSRSFKELQVAFRSFLEMACHCVVLDLFDEELLQAIGKYSKRKLSLKM